MASDANSGLLKICACAKVRQTMPDISGSVFYEQCS